MAHPVRLQTKLRVNRAGDTYEQEADRVSTQVMCMSEPQANHAARERLRTQIVPQSDIGEIEAPFIVEEALRSPGEPLHSSTQAFMEARLGHDFSHVRVHSDLRAAKSANAVNAMAYTVGSDVVFGAAEYAPTTLRGKHLLAHELVHVMQQVPGAAPSKSNFARTELAPEQRIGLGRAAEPTFPVVQRQPRSPDERSLAAPVSDDQKIGIAIEEPKGATSLVTVKLQIVSGSKPAAGQTDEAKYFGGKIGGHVVINAGAEGIFGFSNDEYGGHIFPHGKDTQNSKFGHYTEQEWQDTTKGKQVVTFEINITSAQLRTLKESFQGKPDVDYSVFGYRCASYALRALDQAGVIKVSKFKAKYLVGVTPGALIRFFQRRGYFAQIEEGSEKRKWNKKFEAKTR